MKTLFIAMAILLINSCNTMNSIKENKAEVSNVTLDAKIIRDTENTISYTITNKEDYPIFLFNRLFKWEKSGRVIDPNFTYITLIDNKAIFQKVLLEVPDSVDVEYPEIPFLTKIEAGATFSENIVINLPIATESPYSFAPKNVKKTSKNTNLILQVGWIAGDHQIKVKENKNETLYSVQYKEGLKNQKVLTKDLGLTGID